MDETATPNTRRIVLTGHGKLGGAARSPRAMAKFLGKTPYAEAPTRYLQGDASTRSYARLVLPDRSAVLMNSPRQPDGPPIRDGKPYSALVHLAEDVTPFVAVAAALRAARAFGAGHLSPSISTRAFSFSRISATGCSAERSRAATRWPSFGGRRWMCLRRSRIRDRPRTAAHRRPRPLSPPLLRRRRHADRGVAADRLVLAGAAWQGDAGRASPRSSGRFGGHSWRPRQRSDLGWVLRDYHSPNLIWLPERKGVKKVGMSRLPGRAFRAACLRSRVAAPGRPARRSGSA